MASAEFMSYLVWRMRRIAADCDDMQAVGHLRSLLDEIEEQSIEGQTADPTADVAHQKLQRRGEAA
jgi:hypothetical protein